MTNKQSWQFRIIALCIVAPTLFTGALFAQEAPGMSDYFDAYLDAREETIEGVRARLSSLERGVSALASFSEASESTQSRVNAAYARYGFTPPSHLDFGTRFRDEVEDWLRDNPDIEQLLRDQGETLKALSDQIRAFDQNIQIGVTKR